MSAELKLGFAGDLLLGGEWPAYAQQRGKDLLSPFVKILREIQEVDVFFVNIEGPVSEKVFTRNGSRRARLVNHPNVVSLLKQARACVCVLANNHITDAGPEGIAQTRQLERERIFCVGAGRNAEEAQRPVIVESKGRRIGCLAFTNDESGVGSVIANDDFGCAGLGDVARVETAIKELKEKCDIVVISLHWGIEFFEYPTAPQVALADRLARAGADYVMGHHPHVLQGIEDRNGSLVMYSLGHFFVPPFRRSDGELIRPRAESREFAIVKAKIGERRDFEIFGGTMNSDFVLQPYDARGQQTLKSKVDGLAPSQMAGDYNEFFVRYYSGRLKKLSRERKVEALAGFVREPVRELKRRIAARA